VAVRPATSYPGTLGALGAKRPCQIPEKARCQSILRPEGIEERLPTDPDQEALLRDARRRGTRHLVEQRQLTEGLPLAHHRHDLGYTPDVPGQLHNSTHNDVEAVALVALVEQRGPDVLDHRLGDGLDALEVTVGEPAEEVDLPESRPDARPGLLSHERRDLVQPLVGDAGENGVGPEGRDDVGRVGTDEA
jgi:hypothetical protein